MTGTGYPDRKILLALITRAAGGDERLAKLALAGQDWEFPINSTICAMRDAKIWRRGEDQARQSWARRGVVWLAAGEEKP